ncbi:hypothetical protein CHLRE_06g308600v5 [Chlamydomonas reinhardtii]|uniref:Uncharacterized protein n=1 Tax=Chlamydomonas reinhardtii TaxID=3055 RepID=A0A2K3DRP4_CHLRE|nr:uncharacterized protein CHLRE_06g308600v5 [Chlamydomonas reinhardtii]PNW83148.1 hypothetical protein CHLRE_06g308600v5 [Chlamydomonas reinhardtii]
MHTLSATHLKAPRLAATPRRLQALATVPRAAAVGGPVATRPLLLHAGETTISLPFSNEKAQELQVAIQKLFQTFAEKQKAQRPKRWDMMEWQHKDEQVGIEIFCNPNAHTTAFDAKLLVTLWSQGAVSGSGLKVTTEARLSTFTSDLDSLLQG